MYLQITTKCNMSCDHCCFRCGKNGKHMSREIWEQAIKFAEETEGKLGSITIGGGEPTLHPDFWAIMGLCIGTFENVFIVTNGSQTETALKLAFLAKRGVISCALSQDYWHDPIEDEVIEAFEKTDHNRSFPNENDGREIRDVSRNQERMSPFRDPGNGGDPANCPCEDLLITPSGHIKACGCRNAPVIGDVFHPLDSLFTDYEEREKFEGVDGFESCWKNNKRLYAEYKRRQKAKQFVTA